MAAAKMPETTRPQKKLGSSIFDSTMNTDSAADWVRNSVGMTARPIRPMHTAEDRETTSQIMAMMRDFLISSEWRMDMKRMSTWGMPK